MYFLFRESPELDYTLDTIWENSRCDIVVRPLFQNFQGINSIVIQAEMWGNP